MCTKTSNTEPCAEQTNYHETTIQYGWLLQLKAQPVKYTSGCNEVLMLQLLACLGIDMATFDTVNALPPLVH